MKRVLPITTLIIGILEVYLILQYIIKIKGIYILFFGFVHILLMILLYIDTRKIEGAFETFPVYQGMFLPVIGAFLLWTLHYKTYGNKSVGNLVNNYSKHVYSAGYSDYFETLNYGEKLKTLNITDKLSNDDVLEKKNEIINYYNDTKNYKKLRSSMKNQDSETKHYIATILSSADKEKLDKIATLEKQYRIGEDYFALKKVVRGYKEYLASEILPISAQKGVVRKYKVHMKRLLKYGRDNKETLGELARINILNQEYEQAWIMNEKYSRNYGEDNEYYNRKCTILFNKKEYERLITVIKEGIGSLDKGIAEFWMEVGGK